MNIINKIVIFGATSTIAEQTARLLVQSGASVFCVARNQEKLNILLDDLHVRATEKQIISGYISDLSDYNQHEALFSTIQSQFGEFDSILIAYGVLPDQKRCENNIPLLMESYVTNSLSVISLLSHAANIFETQQQGVIAAISSVAGDRGRQSNYIYGSAKGAINIYLQGLRNRLSKKNISVVTIKPGFVRTSMTQEFKRDGPLWAEPENIAKGIIKAMCQGKNEVYLPWFWKAIMMIIKVIPESIFIKMKL